MSTSEQKEEILQSLRMLKDECDNWNNAPNRQAFDYISLKLSHYIGKLNKLDASVLSVMVVEDLINWTNRAINTLRTPPVNDDIPALNIIIGKLAFQFP